MKCIVNCVFCIPVWRLLSIVVVHVCLLFVPGPNAPARAAEPDSASTVTSGAMHRHQITGLFSEEREADLKLVCEGLVDIKLLNVDFKNAEAMLFYDQDKVFPNAKPEQVVERLDNLLKSISNHTFGVKPLLNVPREKLKFVEIDVVGLDCKACSLAAYEAIYKQPGVEQATASFKSGRVTAWIDPEKTDRIELETALKQKGVTLKGME